MTTTFANATSRLEAFSDGVFVIAITLLAIEATVPEIDEGQSLRRALWDQRPSYAGFILSFLTIVPRNGRLPDGRRLLPPFCNAAARPCEPPETAARLRCQQARKESLN